MAEYYPDGDRKNAFNVFGYAAAQTMVHVLEKCGNDLSRENIMKQAANIKNLNALGLILEAIRFKGEGYEAVAGGIIKGGNDLM